MRKLDFNFNFSYLKNGSPIVTISSLGLAFNKGAIDLLGNPKQIIIGYDEKRHAIGVKDRGDNIDAPYYEFSSRIKNDWIRIGAKDFAKYLSKVTQIDFLTKAKQFIPEFDDESKTLIVIVDHEHLK